jgi:hypothetical protein
MYSTFNDLGTYLDIFLVSSNKVFLIWSISVVNEIFNFEHFEVSFCGRSSSFELLEDFALVTEVDPGHNPNQFWFPPIS